MAGTWALLSMSTERLVLQVGRAALAEIDNLLVGPDLLTFHHHFVLEFMGNEFETAMIKFAQFVGDILPILKETIYPVVQVLVDMSNFGTPWVSVESLPTSVGNKFGTTLELHVETSPHLQSVACLVGPIKARITLIRVSTSGLFLNP
jgi:hypothetical protein